MIAQQHNGPLSNVHASQAGMAEDLNIPRAYKPALAAISLGWSQRNALKGVAQEVENTILKIMKEAASG